MGWTETPLYKGRASQHACPLIAHGFPQNCPSKLSAGMSASVLVKPERTFQGVMVSLSSRKGFLWDVALQFQIKERIGLKLPTPRTHGSPLNLG